VLSLDPPPVARVHGVQSIEQRLAPLRALLAHKRGIDAAPNS
jgi:hypothetical protein